MMSFPVACERALTIRWFLDGWLAGLTMSLPVAGESTDDLLILGLLAGLLT